MENTPFFYSSSNSTSQWEDDEWLIYRFTTSVSTEQSDNDVSSNDVPPALIEQVDDGDDVSLTQVQPSIVCIYFRKQ